MAKALISIDDKLLRQIDRVAKASGLSRSAYIARLAERDVASASGRLSASARNALERLDRVFANAPFADSTAEVRAERDAR